ncbi:ceramide kinase [Schistocerca americana]|uniref:ceramide kinase n=1 Tax=Schistocerca americana TaxID=7009 RepID=UPI001F4F86A8|nr:ceramide kinase [Schistocerca americana]XP_047102749.1 ceramide kinase [Schistocerca piceifrons]XP_049952774.1 ceramide kinase [Schistocerca serialis cubense]
MSDLAGEVCDPVLLNTFLIKKKKCRVYFHRGTLTWETEGSPYTRSTLPLSDVLAAQYVHSADRSQCCGPEEPKSPCGSGDAGAASGAHSSFTLHYAARASRCRWQYRCVTFNHTDPRQVASWVKTIRNYLAGLRRRPRKVLVVVNPFGGRRRGPRVLERQVKPLLAVAGVESEVLLTQRPGHAHDTLLRRPLDGLDAVISIGGDGTFAEVFNGLVLRAARDAGIDHNDPEARLPPPPLRVGVVPGGSTNTMAYCLHGTTDVQTAVIHILLGDTRGLDLCSVHSNGSLLKYYSSVISYGYLGDVLRDSEKFRWMGPKRYDYSGFKKFFCNKGYEGEVRLLADGTSAAEGPRCKQNCARCSTRQSTKDATPLSPGEWKTFRGKFFMVNCANVSCACQRSPNGMSPYCHIGDGCVDVVMVKHSNLFNNLRLLLRMTSKANNVFDLPFVEVHRAREFSFKPLADNIPDSSPVSPRLVPGISVWNCDGEVQWEANMRVRVHCQLLDVFTRGIPENDDEEQPSCKICSF